MSKCSVRRTWNLKFSYWTLLRPKYWPRAGSTLTTAATSRKSAAAAWRRTVAGNDGGKFPGKVIPRRDARNTPVCAFSEAGGGRASAVNGAVVGDGRLD